MTMYVQANGTMLHADQTGDGPSLVFVHGMCGDGRVWDGQVSRLAGRYRCTTYDRRGHSRSPRTDVAETVELHADDLAALITTLELDPTIVVGSSGGARVALDLIRRYPHLVRGAVLSEPPIGTLAPELFAAMIAEVAPAVQRAAETEGPRTAVDAFFAAICPGLWSRLDEPHKDRYRDNAALLFTDLAMPRYEVNEQDIARIDLPTLIVAGATSHPALRTAAQTLASWLPDARYLELDCGHVTYAEQPDAFARAVAALGTEVASSSVRRA
jgi:pimeloyl-ACP methyl ester carboxylesterase